jgi:hypothetical protein
MVIIIIVLKKFKPKTYSRPVGPGFLSILVIWWNEYDMMYIWNKYDDSHSSIHFIQNSMLDSNLKSDTQINS